MANSVRPITRQLEAYEEGWKRDHDEAMRCRNFEENLAVGISIFRALLQIDVTRRSKIVRGTEVFSPEEDDAMREFFRWWLRSRDNAIQALHYYEDKFGEVDGATEFRRCCEEAQEIVTVWKPAMQKTRSDNIQATIIAHSEKPMKVAEMAQSLESVSQPAKRESQPLPFNPDRHPLF